VSVVVAVEIIRQEDLAVQVAAVVVSVSLAALVLQTWATRAATLQ
jgi:hypothetical protein